MRGFILASNNAHKLEEIRRFFCNYEILSLKDIGFTKDIIEDGNSFEENAFIKANAVADYVKSISSFKNYPVLAEDSGLCVKAINNEPGIYSARFSGKGDEGNRQLLLKKLENIQDRTAYFECCAVLIMPNGQKFVADGKSYGAITKEKIGNDSFGYDCLFLSDPLQKTFGQATPEEKDNVSHRIVAMREIKEYLDNYYSSEV
ncbi:MAG: RdgB/HAM1 family non-canonical purine NTP pyrophosphatase [Christensenellales bacterium]